MSATANHDRHLLLPLPAASALDASERGGVVYLYVSRGDDQLAECEQTCDWIRVPAAFGPVIEECLIPRMTDALEHAARQHTD